MIWINFLRTSLSKCLPMFVTASLSQKRASGIWTVQGQRAHAPASWHILAFAHGQTAGNSLNCTKKEPHSTCTSCTWKKVWYAWWSPRDDLLLVFAPPWSKVGTFLMEFALPDQPGEQDCWGGITGSEKGHCGKQRSPAAAWHWAQEIAERARAYGTLVQPVAAISWAFMGPHSAFGHTVIFVTVWFRYRAYLLVEGEECWRDAWNVPCWHLQHPATKAKQCCKAIFRDPHNWGWPIRRVLHSESELCG